MDGPDLSIERPSKMERRGKVEEEPAATATSPKKKLKKKKGIEKLSNGNVAVMADGLHLGQIYSNSQICLPWLKESW